MLTMAGGRHRAMGSGRDAGRPADGMGTGTKTGAAIGAAPQSKRNLVMNWNQTNKNEFDDVIALFDSADAETAAGAIAPGKYTARLVDGNLDKAGTGTACFCLKWELTEGEYQERHLISRHWLSAKAIGRTKGDLAALGIGGEHLRGAVALPAVMAEISVVHRADDAGDLYHEIRRIKPISVEASVNAHDAANAAGGDTRQAQQASAADAGGAVDFFDAEYTE